MSSEPKHNKNKPLRNDGPERFQPKVLVIWLVIFTTIIGLWLINTPTRKPAREWNISEVIKAAEEGRVENGTIKSEVLIGREFERF